MMFKVFIISVGIAFSLQIIHSMLTKGWKFTLEFFGGAFLFGFIRELIYHSFVYNYDFPNMPIKLMNVPIFIPIGWIFTFYLAHEFVNKLLEPKSEKDFKDFIIFASFFATFICIPIETAALNMNWWVVFASTNDNIAVLGLMSGWFGTSVMFFCFFFFIKKKVSREQLWFALILVLMTFITPLHWYVLGLHIIVMLILFKLNKEITFIFLMYSLNEFCSIQEIFSSVPNGIFVMIAFVFALIYILAKLHFRKAKYRLNVKELS
jgi:hypothetical protein